MKTATHVIWNGCDGYDYSEAGRISYTRIGEHKAFEVEEIQADSLPIVDGEIDYTGTILLSDGKLFIVAPHD